jgi:deoxyribonuclease-4
MQEQSTTYNMYWDVGAHIGFSKTIFPSLGNAVSYGMVSCQFFMGNPRSLTRQKISPNDIIACKRLLKRFPMNVFSHFPYVASLCGSVKSLAWSGDSVQDGKTTHMIRQLEYELSILSNFNESGRVGVVIHPGSHSNTNIGLKIIAQSINKINFTEGGKLLLENCAGEGTKLCKNFYEIKQIIDSVDTDKKKHIGVCVDTAHIWGQGDYDLRQVGEVDRMFEEFIETLGIEYFTLLHLNDSEVPLGTKKDRHACLGTGHIWSESFESLIHLLNLCKYHSIPMVLETHGSDMITLAQIQPSL